MALERGVLPASRLDLEHKPNLSMMAAVSHTSANNHAHCAHWTHNIPVTLAIIVMVEHKTYLSKIGIRGGKSRSKAKVAASRLNAKKARSARVRKYPPCPTYNNGSHRFNKEGRCHSPECRAALPDVRRIKD